MKPSSQAVRTLMEVGVASVGAGLRQQAMTIFEGIEAVRPDSEAPMIGAALIYMNSNDPEEAVKVLREGALVKNPGSLEAKMFLGLALRMAGRNAECDTVIKELNSTGDAQAKSFAAALVAR